MAFETSAQIDIHYFYQIDMIWIICFTSHNFFLGCGIIDQNLLDEETNIEIFLKILSYLVLGLLFLDSCFWIAKLTPP